jgi:outer membrane murein-binding lipoprotein Lpp
MGRMDWTRGSLWICGLTLILLVNSGRAAAQGSDEATNVRRSTQEANPASVGQMLQQLQAQVQMLSSQVESLRQQQQSAQAESAELRKELDATKSQLLALTGKSESSDPPQTNAGDASQQSAIEERVARLEEGQQVTDQRMAEQNQIKVESSSKYRVRLSGMVLLNLYENRGSVDNQDFPQLAKAPSPLSSGGSFGGSLRQSQIGLEGFGPTIGGAHTSADVQFDFAGGFPDAPNGVSFGLMRLRTGTVRFDWADTSIIAGQDALFFAPLSPTSIATLAIPAFAYSGNLWSWTPQLRVEHRFTVSTNSSLVVQGGLLDPLAGDKPDSQFYRYPSWGENSGQPAYATRLAWTQSVHGQNLIAGVGGYYSRQDWGYGRTVDAWAGTADVTIPLGSRFELTGQFFRGRGIGGLGGGIGQTALWNEEFTNPSTEIYGLDSMGGWAQLKYKATAKLQFNGAFGMDNPFAGELRQFGGNQTYFPSPLSKNQSVMGNFLYQPKSDIVLSLEYRRLNTYSLDSAANHANIITTSVGYIF